MAWGRSIEQVKQTWKREQRTLSESVVQTSDKQWLFSETAALPLGNDTRPVEELRKIGGVDISFFTKGERAAPGGGEMAVVGLVVLEFPSLKVIYQEYSEVCLTQPYIATFLAFREAPPIVKMIQGLKMHNPEMVPQILVVDGNGLLHPRGCGFACHLGILVDIPTFGVSKNLLVCDGLTTNYVESLSRQLSRAGDHRLLTGRSGRVVGAVYRSTDQARIPVYVSVGHRISLEDCLRVLPHLTRVRVCEPIRQADLRSRQYIRQLRQGTVPSSVGAPRPLLGPASSAPVVPSYSSAPPVPLYSSAPAVPSYSSPPAVPSYPSAPYSPLGTQQRRQGNAWAGGSWRGQPRMGGRGQPHAASHQ